jgi:hypothetical protein
MPRSTGSGRRGKYSGRHIYFVLQSKFPVWKNRSNYFCDGVSILRFEPVMAVQFGVSNVGEGAPLPQRPDVDHFSPAKIAASGLVADAVSFTSAKPIS